MGYSQMEQSYQQQSGSSSYGMYSSPGIQSGLYSGGTEHFQQGVERFPSGHSQSELSYREYTPPPQIVDVPSQQYLAQQQMFSPSGLEPPFGRFPQSQSAEGETVLDDRDYADTTPTSPSTTFADYPPNCTPTTSSYWFILLYIIFFVAIAYMVKASDGVLGKLLGRRIDYWVYIVIAVVLTGIFLLIAWLMGLNIRIFDKKT